MERIGRDVERALEGFGPQGAMPALVEAWPAAVGEAIARRAWPARVGRDGTLHVHTADSVWAFELAQRAQEIAGRLGVPAVRFAPGPLPEPAGDPAGAVRTRPEPGPQELAAAAELAAAVGDPDLRELVRRAAAASLARAPHDRPV